MTDTTKAAAKAAHNIWAHWMKYMFTQCSEGPDDGFDYGVAIPSEKVKRWKRLMNTDFEDLTKEEQESDYEIAEMFIDPIIREETP